MKKEVSLLVLVVLFIFSAGVLAQEVGEVIPDSVIDQQSEEYIIGFVEDTDLIKEGSVDSVSQVNQSGLPDDLQIQDIEENNVGIFEVNFTDEVGVEQKIFVVTYVTNDFKKRVDVTSKNIQNLFFGVKEERFESGYLETATGVQTGEQIGYVMLREGSVTGISTSMEVGGRGNLFITVYKNGVDTGFHNLIMGEGNTIDFDLQSENIVSYSPGDVLSVYVQKSGSISWKSVVTTIETTS